MHSAIDITSKVHWNIPPDRRTAPRTEIRLSGQIASDGETAFVVLRDISAEGFSFRSFDYFPPGTRIVLDLKGVGLMPAEVIWEEATRTGCRFDEPLTDEQLAQATCDRMI